MRHGFRIACALVLGLSFMPDNAGAQWNYPRGYGRYGWRGWGGGGIGRGGIVNDPAAGYMAGLGSFARGQGAYEVEDAQARAINLDTMLKWNQALRARQKQLQQEKQNEAEQRQAQRDARVERRQLEDGTTLNNLLMQILDFDPAAARSSRAKAPIGAAAVREIPFEWNTEAISICIDEMTAKEGLPDVLMADGFAAERDALGRAVDEALAEDAKGDVSPTTMRRVNRAVADFRAKFVKLVPREDPNYVEGEAYFSTLGSLSRLLHDPGMKKVLSELKDDRQITVGDLIGFMHAYNLRFGPATTARQVQIYETLAQRLAEVKGDISAAPNPPPHGVADRDKNQDKDQDGKDLQGAARDAFQGMPWPQLEAPAREP